MTTTRTAADGSAKTRPGRWLILVGVVILLAGMLFGYDQGVIAGALEGIDRSFDVGTTATEIITSWVTLGALLGALVAGVVADRVGRKRFSPQCCSPPVPCWRRSRRGCRCWSWVD